jgi:putative membrane-bound dehydrogenase-like protein
MLGQVTPLWIVMSLLLAANVLLAQAPPDSVERDYAAELPRIAPTAPASVGQKFHVAPGYRLDLVAAEPLVVDPIAAAFDADGRLYVVEMRDYSEQETERLGRIRLLTDTNGDGQFDASRIFAEGLSWPTAVTCFDGGIFVGAPPHLYYLKDTSGDGVADLRRVVYTGFGRSNVQGLMNSFAWGLDNRIHVAVSSSGAEVQRTDDDGAPRGEKLVLRGRDLSFDPRNLDDFRAESGGGQHGLSFDDWGRKLVCSNSDHVQLVMLDDRDLARNPYQSLPSPRISIAADGPQADVFRTSPVEPWREVRTRLRVKGIVPGPVEGGGRAAGYFTGATGITIYRGDAWPQADRGLAIVGDVGSNLIHRKRLRPHGLEFIAERIDDNTELVTSEDNWFRPVQFLNAPDGGLYVLDMYREVIEHPKSLPPVIKQHLDLTSGRDRGRIYRLVRQDFKQPKLSKLSQATTAELVQTLKSPNGWTRDTAARLLYERQDPAASEDLHKLIAGDSSPLAKLHAAYVLVGLHAALDDVLPVLIQSPQPELRTHAIRLARHAAPAALATLAAELDVAHEDVHVRCELALAAAGMNNRAAQVELLWNAVAPDLSDRWLRAAALSSLKHGAGEFLAHLVGQEKFQQHPAARLWLEPLARQVSRQDEPREFAPVLRALAPLSRQSPDTFRALMTNLKPPPESQFAKALAQTQAGKSAREALAPLLAAAKRDLDADDTPAEKLVAAIDLLSLDDSPLLSARFLQLVHPSQPADVQQAALRALLARRDSKIVGELLQRCDSLSPPLQRELVARCLSRADFAAVLLTLLQQDTIAKTLLTASDLDQLRQHPNATIRAQASQVLPRVANTNRAELIANYAAALTLPGDRARGAELFKQQCSTCHKLGGGGHEIGPNLATMKNRGREAILVNVLDPNREVNPQYKSYNVVTTDGRNFSGILAAETASSLTLVQAEGKSETVLRIDIESLRSTGLSLMPEGLEKVLNPQQLADVMAFILAQE